MVFLDVISLSASSHLEQTGSIQALLKNKTLHDFKAVCFLSINKNTIFVCKGVFFYFLLQE